MYGWVTSDAGSPRTTIPRYADYLFVAFTTSFAFSFLALRRNSQSDHHCDVVTGRTQDQLLQRATRAACRGPQRLPSPYGVMAAGHLPMADGLGYSNIQKPLRRNGSDEQQVRGIMRVDIWPKIARNP